MANVISLDPRITAYNRFKDEIIGRMLGSGNLDKAPFMHDFSLILPAKLDNNGTLFFEPRSSGSNKHDAGIYLDENDILAVHKVGLYITSYDDTNKNFAFPEFSYPDKGFFTAAEVAEIERVYKGVLKMDTKDFNPIRDLSTRNFRNVPQIQHTSTTQANHNDDAMYRLITTPIISGRGSTKFQLDLGSGGFAAIAGTPGTSQNYVILRLDGFLASNVSTEFEKWRKKV